MSDAESLRTSLITAIGTLLTPTQAEEWDGDPVVLEEITGNKVYVRHLDTDYGPSLTIGQPRVKHRDFLFEVVFVGKDASGELSGDNVRELMESVEEGIWGTKVGISTKPAKMVEHPKFGRKEIQIETRNGKSMWAQCWALSDTWTAS